MSILIPGADKKITQPNTSSVLGHLWSSFNLDLVSDRGRIRIFPRLLRTTDSASVSNFGCPAAIVFFASSFFVVAGDRVFTGGFPTTTLGADVNTPTTLDSLLSDAIVFDGNLVVTDGNGANVNKRTSAGVWSTPYAALTVNHPHMMCVYGASLFITNFQTIKRLTTAYANDLSITLNNSATVEFTFLRPSSNRIWVGTVNTGNAPGSVFEWDGAATQFIREYKLESSGALACCIKDDHPFIMDTNGRLLEKQGTFFVEVARLPIDDKFLKNPTVALSQGGVGRFIHSNGMGVVNGKIRILINSQVYDNTGSILERCPSGVWEYDPKIGLYHLGSPSYYDYTSGSISDYGQIRLSQAGALAEAKVSNTSALNVGSMLIGATYFTDASSTANALWVDDLAESVRKVGGFVTEWADSQEITDNWNNIFAKYKLPSSTDKIVIKYRTTDIDPVEASITYSSTTQFTTTSDISNYVVGDEVEITQGKGGGMFAHITLIDKTVVGATTTYTVTLDETITGASGTAKARFQKWKKAGTMTNYLDTFDQKGIDITSTKIQFKVIAYMTGKGQIDQVILSNKTNQPIT